MICIKPIFGSADGDAHLGRALALAAGNECIATAHSSPRTAMKSLPRQSPKAVPAENMCVLWPISTEYREDEAGNYILETDGRLRQINGDFKRFIVHYRGQWVSRDDPKVRQFRIPSSKLPEDRS